MRRHHDDVCFTWESFEQFFHDMGPAKEDRRFLARRNLAAGYSKDNCYWSELEDSRYSNNKTGRRGVSKSKDGWFKASIFVNKEHVNLGIFRDFDDAVKAREEGERKYWNK